MCSVIGYVGKNMSRPFVMEGLSRLEYRGYDSAGFACLSPQDNQMLYAKAIGRLENLTEQFNQHPIDGFLGIGHTRWSTHGVPSAENAHPQFDCQKTISIVHNGIIENHHELREQLQDVGHVFHSQTDTETIAHLFESLLISHNTFKSAVIDLVNHLDGAYAFLALAQQRSDTMVVVRRRSPLCIGIGDAEMFVASDVLAFADKTNKVIFLPDESFALVKKDIIELYDFTGKPLVPQVQEVQVNWHNSQKQGFEHYMLKEIYEQKNAIYSTVKFLQALDETIFDHLGLSLEELKNVERIHLLGCGTSWHAGLIAKFFFEQICLIPTTVHLASEFRYNHFFAEPNALYILISQSGETADTLEALRLINSMNAKTIALTNVASSTMVREAEGFLLTQAGHEIAVASTKAFSTQVAALYWFAHFMAYAKHIINHQQLIAAQDDLLIAAELLENSIENYKTVIAQELAPRYACSKKAIFLGRHVSYPIAQEAALKLKEISYIFAQTYPAGELKHGPLALIDNETPVFLFSHIDPLIYQKLVANAQEVKARGGHIILFAFEGQRELIALADTVFLFPKIKPLLGPLAMTGVIQFFVYHIAKELDRPIDKPRNLAKSVTVE
ncbi:glutamine--fructose-6-phosphate aminotransferase [Candidatus Dependentiae bacterium Noda2021]|nr:glutamine--fructose-6-phosphate aminotransferase [Candidatus Dependentiae bacterium Noda2021]